jgi:predicted Holliday junction resolvase-like endonuclease
MIEWVLIIALILAIFYLFYEFSKLKGEINQKSMELFETWRSKEQENFQKWKETDLQNLSTEKAQILFDVWKSTKEPEIRGDAIKKSHDTIKGRITEHLIPYFGEFPYNPSDARFLGTPIDLIIFNGLSEDFVNEIVFLEIKSGKKASLTKRERSVKDCVNGQKISYKTIHLPIDDETNELKNMIIK